MRHDKLRSVAGLPLLWLFILATDPPAVVQTDNTGALYVLIGTIITAILTAAAGVAVAVISRRREREPELDASPHDIEAMSKAYSDCRTDLEENRRRIVSLEHELDEARSLAEFLLRRVMDEGGKK